MEEKYRNQQQWFRSQRIPGEIMMFHGWKGDRISEHDWRRQERKTVQAYMQFVSLLVIAVILEILYAVYILWFV